nr:hypothetical protein BaRGS_017820 [Batillaria attramentaria]
MNYQRLVIGDPRLQPVWDLRDRYSLKTVDFLRPHQALAAKSVSFHAWINNKLYKARDTLTTSRTFNNDGNAYNEASGVFTVPVNGTYIFLANVMVQSDSPRKINDGVFIYVDGKDHGRCWSSYKSHYEQGSCHAIVKLRAGQRVWLHNYYSNSRYYPDSSSFSGALLHADLS